MHFDDDIYVQKKVLKGAGKSILYLDFDGVLHHESVFWNQKRGPYIKTESTGLGQTSCVLFQYAGLLAEMLAPYPEVKIVLSTSWVRSYGCYGAAKYLPQALRDLVIGATFHSRMNEAEFIAMPRGMQIYNDSLRRKPAAWLAIDDDWEDWPESCLANYIRTDEVLGISEPSVRAKLERKLAEMERRSLR